MPAGRKSSRQRAPRILTVFKRNVFEYSPSFAPEGKTSSEKPRYITHERNLVVVVMCGRREAPQCNSPDPQVGASVFRESGGPKDRNDQVGPSGINCFGALERRAVRARLPSSRARPRNLPRREHFAVRLLVTCKTLVNLNCFRTWIQRTEN